MEMEMIGKLTVNAILMASKQPLPAKKDYFAEGEKRRHLFRLTGEVKSAKMVPTPYTPAYRFTGEFYAVVNGVNTAFVSSRCYLPEAFSEQLANALSQHEGTNALGFTVDVWAVPSTTYGYTFDVTPVDKIGTTARQQGIIEKLQGGLKSLPAPTPAKPTVKK